MNYSIVICSFNKLSYLQRTVDAIIRIDNSIERILSDDCSTDGTLEWAEKSGLFAKIVTTGKHDGYRLCTVRNNGIKAVSDNTDAIVLLDADCMPENGYFIGHDLSYSQSNKSLSVGLTDNYDEMGINLISKDHRRPWLSGKDVGHVHWMSAYGGNISFPIQAWEAVGGFDEGYNGAWGLEDADFAYMCLNKGYKSVLSGKSVTRHMRHPPTGTPEMKAGRGPNTKYFREKHGFSPC
jgi:glycosyltransferase involved in cell wall biosynthesis